MPPPVVTPPTGAAGPRGVPHRQSDTSHGDVKEKKSVKVHEISDIRIELATQFITPQ